MWLLFFSSRRRHTRCALVTGVQTCALPIFVDPLDGTREYGEGRDDWAVHVALSIDGKAVAGAVALPGVPLTLCSGKPARVPATPPIGRASGRERVCQYV